MITYFLLRELILFCLETKNQTDTQGNKRCISPRPLPLTPGTKQNTHRHKNKTEQQQKAETHGSCRSRSSADKSQHCTVFQSGYADLCQLRTWPGSKSWIIKDVSLLWKSSLNGSSCNLGGLRRAFIQLSYLYGVLLPDK